tara:strand:+ start:5545 stop:6138 length:594 start_codon:yes stop_codon:yes gene_type:complete
MRFNKAAMFGLDARIALAIFGALSVISGAALYSAIKQSKVIAYQTQLAELEKAVSAYLLDTGIDLPVSSSVTNIVATYLIEDNSVAGWQGPYVQAERETAGDADRLDFGFLDSYYFKVKAANDSSWESPEDNSDGNGECASGSVCYYWVEVRFNSKSILDDLDMAYDGTLDAANGNFRVKDTVNVGYLKSIPMLSQP